MHGNIIGKQVSQQH